MVKERIRRTRFPVAIEKIAAANTPEAVAKQLSQLQRAGLPHAELYKHLGSASLPGYTYSPDLGRYYREKREEQPTQIDTLKTLASITLAQRQSKIDNRLITNRWGGEVDSLSARAAQEKLQRGKTRERLGVFLAALPFKQALIADQTHNGDWASVETSFSQNGFKQVSDAFFRPSVPTSKKPIESSVAIVPVRDETIETSLIRFSGGILGASYGNLPVINSNREDARAGLFLDVIRHDYFAPSPELGSLTGNDVESLASLAVPAIVGDPNAREMLQPVASTLVATKEVFTY